MPSYCAYKLQDADGNSLILAATSGTDVTLTRDIWEQGIPYLKDIWLTDQITVHKELTVDGEIKVGTGHPYATFNAAVAALEALMPSTYSTGWTLRDGDWNGSSWAVNTNYPIQIDGTTVKVVIGQIKYKQPPGEYYTTGTLKPVTLSLKVGQVY